MRQRFRHVPLAAAAKTGSELRVHGADAHTADLNSGVCLLPVLGNARDKQTRDATDTEHTYPGCLSPGDCLTGICSMRELFRRCPPGSSVTFRVPKKNTNSGQ